MRNKENATDEKAKVWRLIERILGTTERAVSYRSDWRIHRETNISVLVTFSKSGQTFYDVSKKDLEQFASSTRAFIVFLAGSHKDAFIVPSEKLREQIDTEGLKASKRFGDFKLHLVRDHSGMYFREIPTLNLAPFFNQYAQMI